VGVAEYIHSVDSLKLAQKINSVAAEKNVIQKVLLQINIANEDSKSGLCTNDFFREKNEFFRLKNIKICGFMTMPPLAKSAQDSQKYFKTLKEIQLQTKSEYDFVNELSMGTTQDYQIALQEGATMIRIGEALLGPRI
jgi:pyridoxal phosphate enzyme (YggS family)